MRGKLAFLLILGMLVGLVYLIGTRTRDAHVEPREKPAPVTEAGAPVASSPSASASALAVLPAADAAIGGEGGGAAGDRTVRVVASSWELAASLLVANGGKATAPDSAAHAAGLAVQVDVATTQADIENRLARGGGDADGADVAVLPLPAFVAAYERIRALEPMVVHVVGWSHGREVLLGVRDGALAKGSAYPGDVAVVTDDPAAETLALFALDQNGTPAGRVHVSKEAKDPPLAALARPLPADRPAGAPTKVELTTEDASRLVPFVAVAARGFAEGHAASMTALVKAWVEGAASLRKDVPAAARRIASEPGAPGPASVLERLSWMGDPGPGDEAYSLGVTGGDAITVGSLFTRDWRLLRDVGSLTSPAPASSIVASWVFAKAFPSPPARVASPLVTAPGASATTLLAHRLAKGDADAVAGDLALLASVFERSALRVTTRPASLAKDAADQAASKYGITGDRIVVAPAALADGGAALVEVLAAQ